MKIAFVINGLGVGGAEKVVARLADAFAELGHQVVIAYLAGDVLIKPSNTAIRLINLNINSVWDLGSAYFKLRKLLIEFKPDVVHSHLFHANILTRLLRITTKINRLITTVHYTSADGWLRSMLYRFTDSLCDISTNVSDEAVDCLIKEGAVKRNRMITVHNGISTQDFHFCPVERTQLRNELGVADETKLIVAIGRLHPQKNYPNLLKAITMIDNALYQYQVVIAGDGYLRNELVELINRYNLEDRIRLLGIVHNIQGLLSAADVFVLSSDGEGFPMVIGEAMACERVVVATDCGGVKEFLDTIGFLVPTKQPEALANALQSALRLSNEESAKSGISARKRIQELYSLELAEKKWLDIYSGYNDPIITTHSTK